MIWLIVLMPVYSANAMVVTFDPATDVTVTDNSATIQWTTDEESTGRVFYGAVDDVDEQESSGVSGTSHSITITTIASSALFNFYISASGDLGTVRDPIDIGNFHSFTTDAPYDHAAPGVVTGLAAPTITQDSITISWIAPSDDDLDYYMVFKDGALVSGSVKQTSYVFSGLDNSTEYTLKVSAVDTSGNMGGNTSVQANTQSADYQPIAVGNFEAESIGTNIYVTWTTNIASQTRVKYGKNPLLLDLKKEVAEDVTQHNITLTGLDENYNYTLMAESCDLTGNCGNSSVTTVQTSQKVDLFLNVDGLDCSASTADYANSNRYDAMGTSSPGADVTAYINGERVRYKRITSSGEFSFTGMDLDAQHSENSIRIVASDKVSADIVCEDRLLLDYHSPEVHFDNETLNLTVSTEQSIQIKGNVTDDTKVTLYIYLQSVDDTTGPVAPTEVMNTSVTDSSIKISWVAPANETEIYKYLVYRSDVPDGPIAYAESTVTDYEDQNVSSQTTYTYTVSAIDDAGNEGAKSSPFSVTTGAGNVTAPAISKITPPYPGLVLTKTYTTTANHTIEFTETVTGLFNGSNNVRLEFVDEAGNKFEETLTMQYDSVDPQIISPSSAELVSFYSPSYTSSILISGQVNKNAGEIWVWVDQSAASISAGELGTATTAAAGEPDEKINIGENGTFEIEVDLATSVVAAISSAMSGGAGTTTAETSASVSGISTTGGTGSTPTKVKLVFVDVYGRQSTPVEGSLSYTPCGTTSYWTVQLKEGGSQINTRELLEGIAAYGFGFDLTWVGGGDASKAKAQDVRVVKATVGAKERENYDFDWLAGEPRVMCKKGNCTKGFVMINFIPMTADANGTTYLEKEKNLSNHRKGECYPLAGCIHLLLEMQIVSDPGPFMAQYSSQAPGTTQPVQIQKQCLNVNIMLDERVDFASSAFVKSLLEASLEVINATLAFLDMIETPLKYVTQVTLGICLITYLAKYIAGFMKGYNCKWSGALSKLTSGGLFKGIVNMAKEISNGMIEKVAGMDNGQAGGACDVEFPKDDPKDPKNQEGMEAANRACKDCARWIEKERTITDKWHLFCDRVMCPSVPSFQHYIKSNWASGKKTPWRGPGESESEGAAGKTNICPVFDTKGSVQNQKINEACKCGSQTCEASTNTAVWVCGGTGCEQSGGNCKNAHDSMDKKLTEGKCTCGNNVCTVGQYCDTEFGECLPMRVSPTGKAITDINSESSSLPQPGPGTDTVPLITGLAAATKSSSAKPAATTSSRIDYSNVVNYEKNIWKKPPYKNAKSDCAFVELGSGPVREMYNTYETNARAKEVCAEGHVPQPACCPFEYMQEWGWGMMWSNELKMSYCLANPEDKSKCGAGQTILRGVTGICQPKGAKPKAQPVVLDNLKWVKGYPKSAEQMIGDDVVYVVDIDEKGSPKTVFRGYYSKIEVKNLGQVQADGRVEINTGAYFIPQSKNLNEWFPVLNNADISQEKEGADAKKEFDSNLKEFRKDIEKQIAEGKIEMRVGKTKRKPTPTNFEHWYRQITGLLGEPGRQYLAQPAGSFIQSVVTLCLSGILSWVVQLRNMLTLLQQCFQTILVTGDGSAGQCQALISQYICDLIKEAISCITQRLGGKSAARIGIGGISGVFSAVADASASITTEAQSRYGDRNLFATAFAAENLLHDACIFMFTGEWPTDFSQLFETAAYLPVNSTIFVSPVTRRWQAYDPQTGFARHVYRVGYSVFAGSDMHFDLKLECSNGICPGGKDGKCDCAHGTFADYTSRNRQVQLPIMRHQSGNCPESGDIRQGQFCTDEVLFVVEGVQGPLRYDKAVVEYRPLTQTGTSGYGGSVSQSAGGTSGTTNTAGFGGTMATATSLQGRGEGTVREIGGPPMGLCEFQIPSLSFKCGVEIPPTGSAAFLSEKLTKPENQPFGIGDNNIVNVKVQQLLPKDAASCTTDCEFTKYLVITSIKNGQSAVIYPPAGKKTVGERLNQDTIHDFSVFDVNSFPQHVKENGEFEIKSEHFGKQAPGSCTPEGVPGVESIPGQVVVSRPQFNCAEVGSSSVFQIRIYFDPTADGTSAKPFFSYEKAVPDKDGKYVFTGKSFTNCEKQPVAEPAMDQQVTCYGIKFTVLKDFIKNKGRVTTAGGSPGKAVEKKQVVGMQYKPPTSTMSSSNCAKDPETWIMNLELRDADSVAGYYQMASGPLVDYDTNQLQKKEIKFKVICGASGTKAASEGSIEELTYRTAVVRQENDGYNKTFGLWADANSLGPEDKISVTDFAWIDPNDRSNGFKITINPEADYGILNIGLDKIGLIPDSQFTIKKNGEDMPTCGVPPCITTPYASINERVIRLKLNRQDPVFTFSGFDSATGVAAMPVGGLQLTYDSPVGSSGQIRLHNPIPGDPTPLKKVVLNNYVQNEDGFDIEFSTDPGSFLEPGVTIGFNLSGLGFSGKPSGISVDDVGMDECLGATGIFGKAVTDIHSESRYLPASGKAEPQIPKITGMAIQIKSDGKECDANTTGNTCQDMTAACTGQDLDKCSSAKGCKKELCNEDDSKYVLCCPPGASTVVPTGTGATPQKTTKSAGPTVKGNYHPTKRECYVHIPDANILIIKTLGSEDAKKIHVYGLTATAAYAVSGLGDAKGKTIILSASQPSLYGVTASGLSSDAKVTITGIDATMGSSSINFYVEVTGQAAGEMVELKVDVLPMGVRTKSDTAIQLSGVAGAFLQCPASPTGCLVLLGGDSIIFKLPAMQSTLLQISKLDTTVAASKACAGKAAGARCTIVKNTEGECYKAGQADTGMYCFSKCSLKHVMAENANGNSVKLPPNEDTFCVGTGGTCKGSTTAFTKEPAGLCPTGNQCCIDGSGKPKPPPKPAGVGGPPGASPGGGGTATGVGAPCGLMHEQLSCVADIDDCTENSVKNPSQYPGGDFIPCKESYLACCTPRTPVDSCGPPLQTMYRCVSDTNECAQGTVLDVFQESAKDDFFRPCKAINDVCCIPGKPDEVITGNCGAGVTSIPSGVFKGGTTLYKSVQKKSPTGTPILEPCPSNRYCVPGLTTDTSDCKPLSSYEMKKYYCNKVVGSKCVFGCISNGEFKALVQECFKSGKISIGWSGLALPLGCFRGEYLGSPASDILNDYGVTVYHRVDVRLKGSCGEQGLYYPVYGLEDGECYVWSSRDNRKFCTSKTSAEFKKLVCDGINNIHDCNKGDNQKVCSLLLSACPTKAQTCKCTSA
ncbi:fibronectin type III domain-containing protein [Nanoarchaeota archaeon]